MGESLKDQLRALGLAAKGRSGSADISLDRAYRIRSRQERQQKAQAIVRKRQQERRRREINQKIQALIKAYAVRDVNADSKRNFLYKGRIRSVLATADQLREINDGKLAVVYLSGSYHLMPFEMVEKVRQFAPGHVPDLQGADSAGEEEHPVPDDLIW
ncbi:MAG: hypothetical protein BMS9Abin30_1216 [Gammaproteobacteria bacterium]|nr:MAG: hypothetical protein BMS9Abin30_1216 [Gammaproteobacteria bacterium]